MPESTSNTTSDSSSPSSYRDDRGVIRAPGRERLVGVGHVDGESVARDDRLRKDGARLRQELDGIPAVARTDMGEHQPTDTGLRRDPGRLRRGGVPGLAGPLQLVPAEGRLVHQEVGSARGLDQRQVRPGVAGIDYRPAVPRLTDQIFGPNRPAVVEGYGLSLVESPPERPLGNAELPGSLG